jgi:hypothetical protein
MSSAARWTDEVPAGEFDAVVAAAVGSSLRGAVFLLEVVPPWPLQVRWLEQQVRVVAPSGLVHSAGEALLAVVVADMGPAEAWVLQERLRERASTHGVRLFAGCGTWPLQGSSAMGLVAAAAASLLDEHTRYQESLGDEVLFDLDGLSIALDFAGELLTG